MTSPPSKAAASSVILRGATLAFKGQPTPGRELDALDYDSDGAVLIEAGRIAARGNAAAIIAAHPEVPVERVGGGQIITAGFVDCHAHYPQFGMMASYGEGLLQWLKRYTFPCELAFGDEDHARQTARAFLAEALRNGTTTACVYATVHPVSVSAFMEEAHALGLCMAAGKVMMDRDAPLGLTDTAQSGYDQSARLIATWHGRGRLVYTVSPRFAITSSQPQLEAAGALWRAHPTTLMQTHLCETPAEVQLVRDLFPKARDYLAVYEAAGLAGPGANFGHAIHLTPREREAIFATGSGISHCPTSNAFLGSGLFDLNGLTAEATATIGLGSDIGAGPTLSMFATMRVAYEIARLRGAALHPVRAWWHATLGSARVMRLDTRIGNLAPGFDADLIVIDPAATPVIAQRIARAIDIADVLFALIMMADDRAIAQTWIAGRRVHTPQLATQ